MKKIPLTANKISQILLNAGIIEKLQALKGVDMQVAFDFLRKNGIVKEKGCVENLIAFLLDRDLPKSDRGSDFEEFEVKSIKAKFTKTTNEARTGGDTPIAKFLVEETDFFSSNIWDKTKKILIPVISDNKIVDLRFFDATKYATLMEADYARLFFDQFSNKKRKEQTQALNSILVRKDYNKDGTSMVMIKGSLALTLSHSIFNDKDNIIENQIDYINELFAEKIKAYKKTTKTTTDVVIDNFKKLGKVAQIELLKVLSDIAKEKEIVYDELPF